MLRSLFWAVCARLRHSIALHANAYPHPHTHPLFTSRGNEANLKNAHASTGLILLICQHCQKVVIPSRLSLPAAGHTVDFIFLEVFTPVLSASEISVPFLCNWELALSHAQLLYKESPRRTDKARSSSCPREDPEAQHLQREKLLLLLEMYDIS